MIVWLVDYDGKIENLALMRLAAYHKRQGDTVVLKRGDAYPELWDNPERLYISCIFRWNRDGALRLADAWGDIAEVGGTGIDIAKTLPPEVIGCDPDYTLYGKNRSVGFISRGCIRNCPWCVVPRKEGPLARVSTAQDIVGDREQAIFLDNNFLALPDFHKDLEWLAARQVPIDFNQGLDARLVTPEVACLLAACKWSSGPRFSLDFSGEIAPVKNALELCADAGIRASRIMIFVLIGFSTLESDVERLLLAREWGVNAYPMGFRDVDTGEEPAKGWDRRLYKKYRRRILRMPQAKQVWADFRAELMNG